MPGSDTTGLTYDPISGQWGTYHTEGQGMDGIQSVFDPAVVQPSMAAGFDPQALGLSPIMQGAQQASGDSGDMYSPGQQTEWTRIDPTDSNKIENWDMAGNYLGSRVKKSGWVSFRDSAGVPLAKMALMAAAPYITGPLSGGIANLTGQAVGTMGNAALTGAVFGGGTAALTGQDILKGALTGGLGGAAFNAAGSYLTPTPQIGDMGQWYDGYTGPASDAGYLNSATGDAAQWYDGYEGPASDLGYMSDSARTMRGFDGEEIGGIGDKTSSVSTGTPSVDTQGPLTQTAGTSSTPDAAKTSTSTDGTMDYNPGTGNNLDTNPDLNGTAADYKPSSILDSLKSKFYKPDGTLDWGKTLAAAGLLTTTLGKLTNGSSSSSGTRTIDELSKDVGLTPGTGFNNGFTPAQMTAFSQPLKAGNQLTRQYAADMPSPIVPGVRYAEGGEVEGPLTQSAPFVGFVQGEGGGQDDLIDASLSAGEYVFDAETVSMLGDGNNTEGARKLDELRAALRAHKRSAPDDEIAPPAAGPLSYMKGGQ